MKTAIQSLLGFNMVLLCLLSGCVSLPAADFSPNEAYIKVVTYNINWGFSEPQIVANYLNQIDADVVFLQEIHSRWEAFLTRQLKKRYPYAAFKDGPGAGGIAFLSKYPIKNVQLIESSDTGWFPALYSEVKTPIGIVQLLNVHLRPPLSDDGRATISSVYRAPGVHSEEIQNYFHKIDLTGPTVIAGDFNEDESGGASRWLINKGFMDSLYVYDRDSVTWRWNLGVGLSLKERYDHIFISEHLRCSGARVDSVNASDHEPVMAVILLKSTANETKGTDIYGNSPPSGGNPARR